VAGPTAYWSRLPLSTEKIEGGWCGEDPVAERAVRRKQAAGGTAAREKEAAVRDSAREGAWVPVLVPHGISG
jgi:hypothetical protein